MRYKDKTVENYGFFTDEIASYYANYKQRPILFVSDIRTMQEEEYDFNEAVQQLAEPIADTLFFAGEATDTDIS